MSIIIHKEELEDKSIRSFYQDYIDFSEGDRLLLGMLLAVSCAQRSTSPVAFRVCGRAPDIQVHVLEAAPLGKGEDHGS